MGVEVIPYAAMVGASAFLIANGQSLLPEYMFKERFVRNGFFKGVATPDADATDAFLVRIRTRERRAAVGSALFLVAALAAAPFFPDATSVSPMVFGAAFVGRALALALLGAREAYGPGSGPRISRGRITGIADYAPAWAIWAAAAAQLALVVAGTILLRAVPWALAGMLLPTAGLIGLAAWLARQPQRAEDPVALAWSDAIRREDVMLLTYAGPVLAATLAMALLDAVQVPGGVLLVCLGILGVVVAGFASEAGSRRHFTARLAQGAPADARR